jgi:hypothetical protein
MQNLNVKSFRIFWQTVQLQLGAIATEDELNEIRESLAAEHHETWDAALVAARKERAKNFTKAIGNAAPVPTNDVQDDPTDDILDFDPFSFLKTKPFNKMIKVEST